jgi:hypothetical protein
MQTEDRKRQPLRQDLQDEQDGLPNREQSPNGEAPFLMSICFSILSILFILSNFDVLTASLRLRNAIFAGLAARGRGIKLGENCSSLWGGFGGL